MRILDLFIIILVFLGFIKGMVKGFTEEFTSLMTLLLSILATIHLSFILFWFFSFVLGDDKIFITVISYSSTFFCVAFLLSLLTRYIYKYIPKISISLIGKIFGGIFGIIKMSILLSLFFNLFHLVNVEYEIINESRFTSTKFYTKTNNILTTIYPSTKGILQKQRSNTNNEKN